MQLTRALIVLALGLLAPQGASAYFSTIDTGELIAPHHYQISFEPQLMLSSYQGIDSNRANGIFRFDTGIDESSGLRGIIGFGAVDFQIGGMYKYVPYPDTEKQPAIGFETGALLARVNGNTEFSLRFHPLVSKKFATEIGDLIPYVSLPLGLTVRTNSSVVMMQIAGGSELRLLNVPNLSLFAELGISLSQSLSYLSIAAAWRFDTLGGGK